MFDYKIANTDITDSTAELMRIIEEKECFILYTKQNIPLSNSDKEIRAMSYNIRMAPCKEDDKTENAWKYRLPKIAIIFDFYKPCIIGLQEISSSQMKSLKQSVPAAYEFMCKFPTRTPIESGLGIAYNKEKIECISPMYMQWLNEKQSDSNAPAWDGSNYERYIVYAKFKNLISDKEFWFMTTHFDHLGIVARRESAKIVMNIAENLNAPAILTGDFNCFPQLGGTELYELLCSHSNIMSDSGITAFEVFGVPGTWIGWDYDFYKQKEGYAKYDFIFVNNTIKVQQHSVIDDLVWDNQLNKLLYPSDHRPVLSDLII